MDVDTATTTGNPVNDQSTTTDPVSQKDLGGQLVQHTLDSEEEVIIEHTTVAAIAKTFVRITHEIHLAEERLAQLEMLHRREIWLAYIKYEMLYMPLIEKRNKLMDSVPHIWPTALLNHPQLVVLLTSERERDLLKHIQEVQVRRCNDSLSDFSVYFRFNANPFIRNEIVVKTFCDGPNGMTTERSEIDWTDEGMNALCGGEKRPGEWMTFLDILLADRRIPDHPLPSRLADIFLRAIQEVCMKPMVFCRAGEVPGKDADAFANIISITKVQVFWYEHQDQDKRWHVASGHLHQEGNLESDGEDQIDIDSDCPQTADTRPFSFARYDPKSDCFLMEHPKYAERPNIPASDGLSEGDRPLGTGITSGDIEAYVHQADQATPAVADVLSGGDVCDAENAGKLGATAAKGLLLNKSAGEGGTAVLEDIEMTGEEEDTIMKSSATPHFEIQGKIGQLNINDD